MLSNKHSLAKDNIKKNKKKVKVFNDRTNFDKFKAGEEKYFYLYDAEDIKLNGYEKLKVEIQPLYPFVLKEPKKYEIDYNKYDFGEIQVCAIAREDSKKMGYQFEGFAFNKKIFCVDEDYVIQHEIQHAFDNLLRIGHKFEIWEREYTAFLAGIVFSEDTNLNLKRLYENMEFGTKTKKWKDFYKDEHMRACLEIVCDLYDMKIDERSEREVIREGALLLLNNMYKKKVGLSYEKIIEGVKI